MSRMRIGAVLMVVALAGGCGGDDDDSGGSDAAREAETEEASEDAAPAKAEYISQADAICADYVAQSEGLTAEAEEVAGDEPDLVAVKEFMDKQLDLAGQLLADVRALTLPAGQAGTDIEAALDSFERATEAVRAETDTPEKALAFMTAGVQQAFGGEVARSAALEASDAADAQAATLGFQTCFSGGQG